MVVGCDAGLHSSSLGGIRTTNAPSSFASPQDTLFLIGGGPVGQQSSSPSKTILSSKIFSTTDLISKDVLTKLSLEILDKFLSLNSGLESLLFSNLISSCT